MPALPRSRIRCRALAPVGATAPVRMPAAAPPPSLQALRTVRAAAPVSPDTLLSRARLLGHHIGRVGSPLPVPLAAPPVALQRARLHKKRIPPTGRLAKALYQKVVHALLSAELSPRGAAKQFTAFLRSDASFASEEALIAAFLSAAQGESVRVVNLRAALKRQRARQKRQGKVGKPTRAKGWTRPLVLSRPGWPKDHRKLAKPGQDIRHIVRNATLKKALQDEFNHWRASPEKQTEAFTLISKALGLPTGGLHSWVMMRNAYTRLYLHKGNLFGGSSAVNRVIGLSADVLYNEGLSLAKRTDTPRKEDAEGALVLILKTVRAQVQSNRNKANKLSKSAAAEFLRSLVDMEECVAGYVRDLGKTWTDKLGEGTLTFLEIGQRVAEIGDNFGFDLIVAEGGLNVEESQRRHKILLRAQLAFNSYTPGDPERLAEICRAFLQA